MVSSITDSERRSEIAERTRIGLEEDLEDLRDQLEQDLGRYEQRIRDVAQRAPRWTSVDSAAVIELFELDRVELPEEGFLGPRMVAIAAAAVDEFIETWFDCGTGAGPARVVRESDDFERDLEELVEFLERLRRRTEQRAAHAHRILEEWMEANLAYLDELRENDLDALRNLVGEGELDTGPDARAEKAQLWEEQRKRADELRDVWNDFHELVEEGADYSREGLGEVESMVGRACEGLEGAHPELRENAVLEDLFGSDAEAVDARDAHGDESVGETVDLDPDDRTESGGSTRDRWLRSTDGGTSEDEGDEPIETGTESSESEPSEMASTRPLDAASEDEEPENEQPNVRESAESEVSETVNQIATGPRDSEEVEQTGEESLKSDTRPRGGDGSTSDGEGAKRSGDEREPEDQDETASPDASRSTPRSLESSCLRIRTEWCAVGLVELGAAFGPPVAFLMVMIGTSIAHLAGLKAAPNPVAAWSWAESAVAVALAWCFCTPMLLGWRPHWSGWRFNFLHRAELRDEATLEIDDSGVTLGRVAFAWDALDAYRLRRWESSNDDMLGWLLIVEPKYYEAVQIIAAEPDRVKWESSSRAIVDPPRDAWQVEEAALKLLQGHLRARGIHPTHLASNSEPSVSGASSPTPSASSETPD